MPRSQAGPLMSIKCPSCGFDSPDAATWCEFCKEPFRSKTPKAKLTYKTPPAPAPAAAAPGPAQKPAEPAPAVPKEILDRVPEELAAAAEQEEKLPVLPPWFRYLAWGFLGVWFVAGMILAGILLGRRSVNRLEPPAPLQTPNIP